MIPSTAHKPVTWRSAAWRGASLGFRLTLLYALGFTIYASVRAALSIGVALEPGAAVATILGVIVSLVPPIVVIAAFLSLVAALIGAVAAMLIYRLLLLNRSRAPLRATAVGLFTGLFIGLALVVLARNLPDSRLTSAYPETYLFWLVLPVLILACAAVFGSRRLNDALSRQ